MKKYLIFTALVFSIKLSAQQTLLFDTANVDAHTKLIGRYPQFDKEKTYRNFNFFIDNQAEIINVIRDLRLGKEVENSIQNPSFRISIVQGNKEIRTWIISPTLNTASYNGHTYKLDLDKLRKLSTTYPFDYRFSKVAFKDREEYNKYLANQKTDKSFLFDYSPQFKYEGSFEIQFPRNEIFSNPKAISEYLKPMIEKIVEKGEYTIAYYLNDKNIRDETQFTMTISGSKYLFDSLQLGKLKKENWKNTVEEGWFFYRIQ